MSEEREYGVRCKNPDCKYRFVLGKYMTNPKHAGDLITFVSIKPGKAKCPSCGQTYEYTQDDLEQIPK